MGDLSFLHTSHQVYFSVPSVGFTIHEATCILSCPRNLMYLICCELNRGGEVLNKVLKKITELNTTLFSSHSFGSTQNQQPIVALRYNVYVPVSNAVVWWLCQCVFVSNCVYVQIKISKIKFD